MQSKSHSSTTHRKRRRLLWVGGRVGDGTDAMWKGFCGSDECRHFKLFLENVDVVSSGPKRKRTRPSGLLWTQSSKASICDGMWAVCAVPVALGNIGSIMWRNHVMPERYIQVLEQHMLPSKQRLFHGRPCLFQQDECQTTFCTFDNSVASK